MAQPCFEIKRSVQRDEAPEQSIYLLGNRAVSRHRRSVHSWRVAKTKVKRRDTEACTLSSASFFRCDNVICTYLCASCSRLTERYDTVRAMQVSLSTTPMGHNSTGPFRSLHCFQPNVQHQSTQLRCLPLTSYLSCQWKHLPPRADHLYSCHLVTDLLSPQGLHLIQQRRRHQSFVDRHACTDDVVTSLTLIDWYAKDKIRKYHTC